MNIPFQEASQAEHLYRLIIDNVLDAFIAIDDQSRILEWSVHAETMFGWKKAEVLGKPLTDTIIPRRYREAHTSGLNHYRKTGEGEFINRRVEVTARRKDGEEIPVELTVTPIMGPGGATFFALVRDLSQSRALEESLQRQCSITTAVFNNVAGAIVVVDMSGRVTMINPAARRLLHVDPLKPDGWHSLDTFDLFLADRKTPYPEEQRPMRRALRGEHVDDAVAFVRHPEFPEGLWISANARPLVDSNDVTAGAVAVFHDITERRHREEEQAEQARLLEEQASLLDLARDAIVARTTEDIITYWNLSAERLYGYTRSEAIGQVSHVLLKTRFPLSQQEIRARVDADRYWEGELVHTAKDGREITVFSQWALELHEGRPYRYLETNTDITQRVKTEQALRHSQENFRLLVESATDHAIIMLDPAGKIQSWNPAAENIIGLTAVQAIGLHSEMLFTEEDRAMGEPEHELEEARTHGRAEDNRWHLRSDGRRFWATGVVTPLRNDDGSLRGYAKIMRDQTAQRVAEEQTRFLANHDALTGLPNRVNLSNQLHQAIAMSQRTRLPLAVLLLDLDRFKYVNDTFGHHMGDLLLKEVALRIMSSIRQTDFVARLGGDEFVIIQADVSQPEAAETLARKLVLELARPYQLEGQEVQSGTSIGLCVYPADGQNSVELLKRADLALYRAKHAGRHTYQFYTSDLHTEQNWRKDREAALRAALKNHQFELYYQPQIGLGDWKISTVEALLRWNASELETILPGEFLDIAEQSGIIVDVGEWALREACHQVRRWQSQGMSNLRLSVNCSARQFSDPRFVAIMPAIVRDAGLQPDSVEIEVPETMLARHPEVKTQLAELRAQGMRLTIDNFGTGATALKDLKDFGVDVLKIDKGFVQHLPHRREDAAIASAIISLAHNLGIDVVAGGVETAEQLAYLKARDCTSAQGFIFSPPLPAAKFEQLVHDVGWTRVNSMLDGHAPTPFDMH
ncbi:hypothetical protein GCM10027343_21980 [Noviherbaspirillum agri]